MKRPFPAESRPFLVWVVANSVGWPLGVMVGILLAKLQDFIHIGNAVYLGAGMGFTMGLAQRLSGRKWFGATSSWMWASTIGITTPCLLSDLVGLTDSSLWWLPALAAIGGLLSGLMQRNHLRSLSPTADWWVVVSAIAWVCPVLLIEFVAVPRHPQNTLESVRNVGSMAFGGVLLGAITGIALTFFINSKERTDLQ